MFKDMQTSKVVMQEFLRDNRSRFSYSVNVNICEYGKWPETIDQKKMQAMRAPPEMDELYMRLKTFYENKHAGRKFFIRWDKGGGEAVVTFGKKKIEKILIFKSTYQIMIMLCFNKKNPQGKPIWKYNQLQEMLGIPDADLQTAILPVIHPNIKVLEKKPGGKKIEPGHMFRLNGKFSNPKKKIVIPIFHKVQTSTQEAQIPQEIAQQRRHQMDAAIVRIMKARRQFMVIELLGEVIQQLQSRFSPDPKQIKKRIEVLISQDYLERDEDDRNMLIYKQ